MKSRLLLLAALATAAGCKKEQPPAPAAPPASAAAAPSPAPAPEKKDPLASVPQTDSTLSLLEPREGKCQWLRVDPVAQKRAVVAAFDGDCKGARIAWSADLRKALVWFHPELVQLASYSSDTSSPPGYPDEKPTPGATHRMYEVTVPSGEVRTVPVPAVDGELQSVGYKGADLIVLSLQSLSEAQLAKGSVTIDDQTITFAEEQEGLPALAHAYKIDKDGQRKRVEARGTSQGGGMSAGVDVLDASGGQGLKSIELLESHLRGGEAVDEAQRAKLLAFVPAPLVEKVKTAGLPEEAEWGRGRTSAGAFYVWQITGDTTHTTGHLVFEVGGQLSPAKDLGFTDGDLVAVNTRGPFLLVASEHVGSHPRLYDLSTGKLVFRSDTARATTFWPVP